MKSNSVPKIIFIFLLIIIMGIPTFLLAEKPEEEVELAQVRIGVAPYTMFQIYVEIWIFPPTVLQSTLQLYREHLK